MRAAIAELWDALRRRLATELFIAALKVHGPQIAKLMMISVKNCG